MPDCIYKRAGSWLTTIAKAMSITHRAQSSPERLAANDALIHGVARAAWIAARLNFLLGAIKAQVGGRIVEIAHVSIERAAVAVQGGDGQLHDGVF